jgi:hypothetical protein
MISPDRAKLARAQSIHWGVEGMGLFSNKEIAVNINV